jgi:large conductance mechanosensitive channel
LLATTSAAMARRVGEPPYVLAARGSRPYDPEIIGVSLHSGGPRAARNARAAGKDQGRGSMKLLYEFRDFAMKGNVVDLAVGVIIGAAFGKIVSSLVENVLMPVVGLLLGGVDFTKLAIKVGSAELKYGAFIQSVFDFLIIAACIFAFLKVLNSMKRPAPIAAPPPPSQTEIYLREIRDALVKK